MHVSVEACLLLRALWASDEDQPWASISVNDRSQQPVCETNDKAEVNVNDACLSVSLCRPSDARPGGLPSTSEAISTERS